MKPTPTPSLHHKVFAHSLSMEDKLSLGCNVPRLVSLLPFSKCPWRSLFASAKTAEISQYSQNPFTITSSSEYIQCKKWYNGYVTPYNWIWILALCLCFSVFYPHWHVLQLHCRPRILPLHRKINGIWIVISIISVVSEWRWKQVLVWPAGRLPYWPSTAWRQRGWVSEAKYVTIVTFNINMQTHTNLMSFRMWRILWIGGTQWSVSHKWTVFHCV